MSLSDLMKNQVSTRFMLSMAVVVGIFAYAWFGPMRYGGDAVTELLGGLKFVVATYVGSKTIESGLGRLGNGKGN